MMEGGGRRLREYRATKVHKRKLKPTRAKAVSLLRLAYVRSGKLRYETAFSNHTPPPSKSNHILRIS